MNELNFSADYADPLGLLNALPHAVLTLGADGEVLEVNSAAEVFFDRSRSGLRRKRLSDLLPLGSPLLDLVAQVRTSGASVNEYRIDAGTPRTGDGKLADVFATPLRDPEGGILIMLQERSIAEKMDRQLHHRGAARPSCAACIGKSTRKIVLRGCASHSTMPPWSPMVLATSARPRPVPSLLVVTKASNNSG